MKVVEVILEWIPFECIKKHTRENVKNVLGISQETLPNNDEIPSSALARRRESFSIATLPVVPPPSGAAKRSLVPRKGVSSQALCASVRPKDSHTHAALSRVRQCVCVCASQLPAGLHTLAARTSDWLCGDFNPLAKPKPRCINNLAIIGIISTIPLKTLSCKNYVSASIEALCEAIYR